MESKDNNGIEIVGLYLAPEDHLDALDALEAPVKDETAETRLVDLAVAYANLEAVLEPYMVLQRELRDQIREIVLDELGFSPDPIWTPLGSVEILYRRGSAPGSRWDSRGLAGYAVAHPEILAFCEPTPAGSPTVAIKVKR